MSPLYEYRCPDCGHQFAQLRKPDERHDALYCQRCLTQVQLVMSVPAKRTDGIYSYAPNIGSADEHERKNDLRERRKDDPEAV